MLNLLLQLWNTNPGASSYIASKLWRGVERKIEAKRTHKANQRAEEYKARIAREKYLRSLFDAEIKREKKALLSSSKGVSKFSSGVLNEYAEQRLLAKLPARIRELEQKLDEHEKRLKTIQSEAEELEKWIEEMNERREVAKDVRARHREALEEYREEVEVADRLNGFCDAYVSIVGLAKKSEDFKQLKLIAARKQYGITDEEFSKIKSFAASNSYAQGIAFVEYPQKPKMESFKKAEPVGPANKKLESLNARIEKAENKIERLTDTILVLRSKTPKDIECIPQSKDSGVTIAKKPDAGCKEEEYEESPQDLLEGQGQDDVLPDAAFVEEVIRHELKDIKNSGLFLCSAIPPNKLANARRSMNVQEETVYLLMDSTVFGGAREGLLLTGKALYFKNLLEDPVRIPLNVLPQVKVPEGCNIHFGDKVCALAGFQTAELRKIVKAISMVSAKNPRGSDPMEG